MKHNAILLIALLFAFSSAFAQQTGSGTVKGLLTDTSYREIMADATISIMHATDSTVLFYTRADAKGAFIVKNLANNSYRLVISFQGYQPATRKFSISATTPDVDLGSINMNKSSDMLEEVVVERPPITIKGDTVEFAASAFKTKPNAVAEDLLKKLPGVEVDKDGNVTAQGEAVQKIYVDGKEFFGNDPKMATKNITAEMIESVQVFDDMSEQAKFTRIDDGSRSKTINIKLKKNMRQGYFGRATAGYGTADRYMGTLTANRFMNDRRISLVASANNLNKQGFSSRDIIGGMGGFGGGGGGGRGGGGGGRGGGGGGSNGITNAKSLGLNYTDVLGKVDVQASYMYGETKSRSNESSSRQSSFPNDSVTVTTSESSSLNTNRNHNLNFKIEYEIDSMNSILYTPNLTLQNSNGQTFDTSSTHIFLPGKDYLGLSNVRRNSNERSGFSLNNEFLYRRRFNKPGRTLTLGYKNAINNSNGTGTTFSPIVFYNNTSGLADSTRDQDFISSQKTKSNNNVISTSYTEPLGKDKILEFNYAYTNNYSTSDRNAYSYNSNTKEYDSINAQQTNYFENKFLAHRVGANFRYRNKIYGFQVGGAMQTSSLDNSSIRGIYSVAGKDSVINTKQSYINFFPTANFNYDFSKRKNLKVSYQGRTNQPNVSQLQDVRDETNALRTSVGNSALKQEFGNKLNVSYKTFNETNFRYMNVNVNYNMTSNKIVNSISEDTARGKGVQLIKPVNLNGAYDASYDISFGIPLRKGVKGSSINLGNRMGYNRGVSRLYGSNNFTNTFSASQSAGLNLDVEDKLNIELRARVAYNSVKYDNSASVQKISTVADQQYFTQSYSTDITYYILKNLVLSTDFDLAINSGRAAGFNQNVPLWNGGIAYQMFKKKNGEIKLTVNDILNQNSNIERTIRDNDIIDTRTVVLQRYFMLTFTYNFSSFGDRNALRKGDRDFRGEGRGERGNWNGQGGGMRGGGGGMRGGGGGMRGGGGGNRGGF